MASAYAVPKPLFDGDNPPWPASPSPSSFPVVQFCGYGRLEEHTYCATLDCDGVAPLSAGPDATTNNAIPLPKVKFVLSKPMSVTSGRAKRFRRKPERKEITFCLHDFKCGLENTDLENQRYWVDMIGTCDSDKDNKDNNNDKYTTTTLTTLRFFPESQMLSSTQVSHQMEQLRWRRVLLVATRLSLLRDKLIALDTLTGPVTHLGDGGFGSVFKAHCVTTNRNVAVKKIVTTFNNTTDTEAIHNVLNEALILQAAAGKYTLCFDGITWDAKGNAYYLITEALEGGSLREALYSRRSDGVRTPRRPKIITTPIVTVVLRELLRGLAFLHNLHPQILHRDLKPDNLVFVRPLSELTAQSDHTLSGPVLKIIDFGVARQGDTKSESGSDLELTANIGTDIYRAPEVITEAAMIGRPPMRATPYDTSVDMYAVGLIAWELRAHKMPYTGDGYRGWRRWDLQAGVAAGHRPPIDAHSLSPAYRYLVSILWHPSPKLRFSAVDALAFVDTHTTTLTATAFNHACIADTIPAIVKATLSRLWMYDGRYASLILRKVQDISFTMGTKDERRESVGTIELDDAWEFVKLLQDWATPGVQTDRHITSLHVLCLLAKRLSYRSLLVSAGVIAALVDVLDSKCSDAVRERVIFALFTFFHAENVSTTMAERGRVSMDSRRRATTKSHERVPRPVSMVRERLPTSCNVSNNRFLMLDKPHALTVVETAPVNDRGRQRSATDAHEDIDFRRTTPLVIDPRTLRSIHGEVSDSDHTSTMTRLVIALSRCVCADTTNNTTNNNNPTTTNGTNNSSNTTTGITINATPTATTTTTTNNNNTAAPTTITNIAANISAVTTTTTNVTTNVTATITPTSRMLVFDVLGALLGRYEAELKCVLCDHVHVNETGVSFFKQCMLSQHWAAHELASAMLMDGDVFTPILRDCNLSLVALGLSPAIDESHFNFDLLQRLKADAFDVASVVEVEEVYSINASATTPTTIRTTSPTTSPPTTTSSSSSPISITPSPTTTTPGVTFRKKGPRDYKVVMCGDSGVGKSCLFNRFRGQDYAAANHTTVGCDMTEVKISVPDPRGGGESIDVTLNVWDTGGQERYHAIAGGYLKDADACILVYPLRYNGPHTPLQQKGSAAEPTKEAMLKELGVPFWVNLTRKVHMCPRDPVWLLLGNKADLGYEQRVYDAAATYRDDAGLGRCDHEMVSAKETDHSRFRQVLRNLAKQLVTTSPIRSRQSMGVVSLAPVNMVEKPSRCFSCGK